jgi:hypothetical protein
MLVDVCRASLLREIRRERRLPVPGDVLVNEGQKVEPLDVIAEAELPDQITHGGYRRQFGCGCVGCKAFPGAPTW